MITDETYTNENRLIDFIENIRSIRYWIRMKFFQGKLNGTTLNFEHLIDIEMNIKYRSQ